MTRRMRSGMAALLVCTAAACGSAAAGEGSGSERRPAAMSCSARIAPEKFIPTFVIKYGNHLQGIRPPEETANFDMIVSSQHEGFAQAWATNRMNSWQTLKRLNSDMTILIYASGPTRYNTTAWGCIGEGWEWMKANHGNDAEDRWTAKGETHGTYLRNVRWGSRMMRPGNSNWQQYWLDNFHRKFWGGGRHTGADGIFSDETGYRSLLKEWAPEGEKDQRDCPLDYRKDGKWLCDKYRGEVNAFFARAVPWLEDKELVLTPNFGGMAKHPERWAELESQPHVPFAAMEEAGFVCEFGKAAFNVWGWETMVKTMRSLKKVRCLMTCHGRPKSKTVGLARMDVRDEISGMTGRDALWFSMTSFLLAFDDVRGNGYMNFTVWGYTDYHWLDEFDPEYLHLGRAVEEYAKAGPVYMREFEDGWIVVNPSKNAAAKGIPVPRGRARVLDHGNFKAAERAPLVTQFDLPSLRGIVLLKEGRKVGNQDNL